MTRDQAVPHILAEAFLRWWRHAGRPELHAAFQYWCDREHLPARRRASVWRRLGDTAHGGGTA